MISLSTVLLWIFLQALFLGAGRARRERLWNQERYLLEAAVERAQDEAFRAEARATAAEEALARRGGPFR